MDGLYHRFSHLDKWNDALRENSEWVKQLFEKLTNTGKVKSYLM